MRICMYDVCLTARIRIRLPLRNTCLFQFGVIWAGPTEQTKNVNSTINHQSRNMHNSPSKRNPHYNFSREPTDGVGISSAEQRHLLAKHRDQNKPALSRIITLLIIEPTNAMYIPLSLNTEFARTHMLFREYASSSLNCARSLWWIFNFLQRTLFLIRKCVFPSETHLPGILTILISLHYVEVPSSYC